MHSLTLNKIFCKLTTTKAFVQILVICGSWQCNGPPESLCLLFDTSSLPSFLQLPVRTSKTQIFVKTCLLKNLPIVLKTTVKYLSMMKKTLRNLVLALSRLFCSVSTETLAIPPILHSDFYLPFFFLIETSFFAS